MRSAEFAQVRSRSFLFYTLGSLLVAISLGVRLYVAGAESEAQWSERAQLIALGSRQGQTISDADVAQIQENFKSGSKHLVASIPSGARVLEGAVVSGEANRTPTLLANPSEEVILETRFRVFSGAQVSDIDSSPVILSLKPLYLILFNLLWPGLILLALPFWLNRKEKVQEPPPVAEKKKPRRSSGSSLDTVVKTSPPRPPTALIEHSPNTPEELIYGRFVRGSLIGQGSMGEVFKCRSCIPHDDRTYALKLLLPEWGKSEDFRKRFEREIDICLKLSHPNLVRAHGRGEKDGQLWMVMDYLEGRELCDWLQENKPSEREVLEMARSIADGLDHAHQQGVVHRDLKPSNIIVKNSDQQPVIADFGLARGKHYDTITKTNTTLGTPTYMPPEQITGGLAGPQGDLYSLGCIIYEALSGAPPIDEPDVMKLLSRKLMETPPPLSSSVASAEVAAMVSKLLESDPINRYSTAREVSEFLSKLIETTEK